MKGMARESESGLPIEPVYGPGSLTGFDPQQRLGEPGEYPFTRGVHGSMYVERPWTMRQYAGFATAAESNRRYHQLIQAGTTGLSVAFDLPTQMGFDSDAAMALGEVGRVGVAIDSIDDMRLLLDRIPLAEVSTSMTINAPAAALLLLYQLVAEEQGVSADQLTGTIQNDILKEYIARGTYIYPPQPSMRLVADSFAYCMKEIPHWNMISISGYHMAEAGAKFRAARRLWARIMREEFGAVHPRSQMLRFHTQTAGVQLTAQQPEVNMARVTIQALAAVLGGTQSLHANSYDEAMALPSEKAARLAVRTQQVLAHETDLTATVDPFAGSYAIEYKPLHMDPAIESEQAQRLALLRASRDKAAHRIALDDLKEAATGDRNLLYPMREALRARATVGEVCDAFREVYGVYKPPDAF
jgi:methylmalonyl-CoA mutase N-terminal domain/subunit